MTTTDITDNGKVRTLAQRANGETYIESERRLTAEERGAAQPTRTEECEIVSVKGGKFHRPQNTIFDSGGNAFRDARLMRCGRSLVPLNFFETVVDADKYTGGRLESYICQQCEKKVSHLWRVAEVLKSNRAASNTTAADLEAEREKDRQLYPQCHNTTAATPRPWHTKDGKGAMLGSSGKRDSVFIVGRDLSWLAELPAGAISEANAALIVQAVNSFDALRDALDQTARHLHSLVGQHSHSNTNFENCSNWLCVKNREALAEGKSDSE